MEYKKPFDQLEDPHKKAQDAIDHAREAREEKLSHLGDKDAPFPHLIADGSLTRCSLCGQPFQADAEPSLDAAFINHLSDAHKRYRKPNHGEAKT